MQVAVACKHGTISPETQEYMRSKAEKLLTYFERVTAITVTVTFDKLRCKIEILVDAEHKHVPVRAAPPPGGLPSSKSSARQTAARSAGVRFR